MHHGVTIIGYTDLPSRMAAHGEPALRQRTSCTCSPTWAAAKSFQIDLDDEVVRGALVAARRRADLAAAQAGAAADARGQAGRSGRVAAKPAAGARQGHGTALDRRGWPAPVGRSGARRGGAAHGARPASRPREFLAAPHGVRAGLLRRLAGGLERHAGAAHAAHERHQRHQRHHHRRRHAAGRRPGAGVAAGRPAAPSPSCSPRSTSPAASSSPSACCGCSAGSEVEPCTESLVTVAYLVAGVLFILSLGGLSSPGDRAARQPLRHRRHGASPSVATAARARRAGGYAGARRRHGRSARPSARCWPRASR